MAKKNRKTKYKAPPRVKVERCWYVKGYDGKPIVGLSWDSGNGYYFPTHFKKTEEYQKTGKRPHFTKDYDNAIIQFRQWSEEKAFTQIEVDDNDMQVESTGTRNRSDAELAVLNELAKDMSKEDLAELGYGDGFGETSTFQASGISNDDYADGSTKITHTLSITEPIIIAKAKELFAKYSPSVIAEKFGMPSLGKIGYANDLKEPWTLKQIADAYFNKVEFENASGELKKELDKTRKTWKHFCRTIQVRTANEITPINVKKYYDSIFNERKRKNYSTTWMKGHFERVKRIFNNAIVELGNDDDIITAKVKLGAKLKVKRDDVQQKPYRIKPKQFNTILEHSNIEERCMWMMSMNLAYYSVDIATVPLSAIDFEDKLVIFRRGKTGKHRSGVLWDNTIDAIREYQKKYPHNGKTLFWNFQDKRPYLPNRIRKRFVAVLEKGKIRGQGIKRLTHSNFRDSLKSICVEKGIRLASVDAVMGHFKKNDEYVDPEVFPKISEDACSAVYEYYFENKKA